MQQNKEGKEKQRTWHSICVPKNTSGTQILTDRLTQNQKIIYKNGYKEINQISNEKERLKWEDKKNPYEEISKTAIWKDLRVNKIQNRVHCNPQEQCCKRLF